MNYTRIDPAYMPPMRGVPIYFKEGAMVRPPVREWLERLVGAEHQTASSNMAAEILRELDYAATDEKILATIEGQLLEPDDIPGQINRLVAQDEGIRSLLEQAGVLAAGDVETPVVDLLRLFIPVKD